jgi:predicted metal-dependent peptidase
MRRKCTMAQKKIDFDKHPLWSEKPLSGVEPIELLKTARLQLFMKKKFFGRLAMRLQFIESMQLPTAAIDVRGRLYYNPYYINNCRLNDAIFTVAHEVFHLVQRTHARFPDGGIHRFWNIASDIINNQSLNKNGIAPREDIQERMHGYSEEHQKYDGWVAEKIYYDLIQEASDQSECEACKQIAEGVLNEHRKRSKQNGTQKSDQGSGDESGDDSGSGSGDESGDSMGGDSNDSCGHGSGDDGASGGTGGCEGDGGELPPHTCGAGACCSGVTSDQSQGKEVGDAEDIQKWKRGILGAAEGLNRGDLPGDVQRILDELSNPTVDWKSIIRSKASAIFGKGRYQWKRPGRRSQATGIRFPSRDPEMVGALVWLDTSGSISQACMEQFAGETYGILTQTGCNSILVGCHHVNGYSLIEVKNRDDIKKIPYVSGGTSHIDVFDIVNGEMGAEGIQLPKGYTVGMVVCLTDMMSNFPESYNGEVVWGVPSEYFHRRSEYYRGAPFGREIEITIDVRKE